jgi:hypothetical protein
MGLPFKSSEVAETIPRHFCSIKLNKNIFNTSNQPIPFDIGTDITLSGFQTGSFDVLNENVSIYNNNGGFIIRKNGIYRININFKMIDHQPINPSIIIKKNGTVQHIMYLVCFNSTIIGSIITSNTYSLLSELYSFESGDIITFAMEMNSTTPKVEGNSSVVVSSINLFEL